MSESDTPAWSVVLSQTDQSGLAYAHQRPETLDELSFLLAAAQKNNTAVVIGTPLRIPPQTSVPALVYADLGAFDRVIEYSIPDQVIHVETGITLGDLRKTLVANQQWWPVFLPDDWTVLDAIHYGDAGATEYRFSSVRDLVLGCTVVTSSGAAITCGGKVVKNVTGYDMTKLFIGSRGAYGAVISAQLRLYALPSHASTLQWSASEYPDVAQIAKKLVQSGLPFTALHMTAESGRFWQVSARVQGSSQVVDEITAAATSVVESKGSRLSSTDETQYWQHVLSLFAAPDDDSLVRLAAPSRAIVRMADYLRDAGPIEIRPLSGKVIVRTEQEPSRLEVARTTAEQAAQPEAPIVVAFSDEQYNYRVERYPAIDEPLRSLKARLKSQFDPCGILNPFVEL